MGTSIATFEFTDIAHIDWATSEGSVQLS